MMKSFPRIKGPNQQLKKSNQPLTNEMFLKVMTYNGHR